MSDSEQWELTCSECGIALEDFHDFQEGDVIEFYRLELVVRGVPQT